MRRNISIFAFFISLYTFAQNGISPGSYIVKEENSREKFSLQINPDQTFQVVIFDGNIKYENGKYRLAIDNVSSSSVGVELNKDVPVNKSNLKIEIDPNLSYYGYAVYYSFDNQTDFKKISELFESATSTEEGNYKTQIERPKSIFILEKNSEGQNQVARFDIPSSVGGIKLNFQYTNYKEFENFQLVQDPSDNSRLMLDVGSEKIDLVKKEAQVANANLLKPEMSINTTFKFPEEEVYGEETYAVDEAVAAEDVTPYEFKTFNSLTEAQNEIAGTDRFLVVGFDKSNDFPNNFNEMVKSVGENYYYYQSEEDGTAPIFEFYPLKESEKSVFTKNDIKDFPHIAILNTDGIIVYHSQEEGFEGLYYKFIGYYNNIDYLKGANAKYKFDKVMKAKKVSLKDFQDALTVATQSIQVPYDSTYENEVGISTTSVQEVEVEADDVAYAAAAAVDDTDAANYYQLQTKKEEFEQKWFELVKSHQNDATPDMAYIDLLKRSLINMGGLALFYNTKISRLTDADKLGIDYLLKFEKEIEESNNVAQYEYDQETINMSSKQVIANYFSSFEPSRLSETDLNSFNQYFKSILNKTNYDYSLTSGYLNSLSQDEFTKENIEIYSKFFNNNFNQNTSIIEQLDNYFENNMISEYAYNDWNSFKYDFSNLANNMAWYVVTDIKDANMIKEAIKWSEASIAVSKNNGYYLDTLAQLYYKDGQKAKAIETEKKAIASTNEMEDPGTLDEMKSVLHKMEKGVY